MRSILRFLWVPILALGGGLYYGTADEPLAPAKGTVLILQDYQPWEGDIVRKGNQYIVRKNRAVITFPKEQVMRLCQDWDDVYVFMKSQSNLHDPDERKKLAKFFLVNNVPEIARIEIDKALEMRPQDTEAKQYKVIIENAITKSDLAPSPSAGLGNSATAPESGLSQESRTGYINRVQPILLKHCASCHSGGRGGKFQLYRYEGGQTAAVERSLISIISQLDLNQPEHSLLLIKAGSRHGNQPQAPFRSRQEKAYLTLASWVEQVVNDNPHLNSDSITPSRRPNVPTATKGEGGKMKDDKRGIDSSSLLPPSSFAGVESKNSPGPSFPNNPAIPVPLIDSPPHSPPSPGRSVKLPRTIITPPPLLPMGEPELPANVSPPQSQQSAIQTGSRDLVMANFLQLTPVQTATKNEVGRMKDEKRDTDSSFIPHPSPFVAGASFASDKQPAFPLEASAPLRLCSGVQAQALPMPPVRTGNDSNVLAPSSQDTPKAAPIQPIQILSAIAPSQPVSQDLHAEPRGDPWSPDIFNQYMPQPRR